MRNNQQYKYTRYLTDLKNLEHIEWFIKHSDEYEFQSEEAKKILERLKRNIAKKHILYSVIVDDYTELVKRFENNPYNYSFEILGKDGHKDVGSQHGDHYFIRVRDKDNRQFYTVPYAYILDNEKRYDCSKAQMTFEGKMAKHKEEALENFEAVKGHYNEYLEKGGVKDALGRYAATGDGMYYHLKSRLPLYIFYNFMLVLILQESQFFKIVTHFWQLWSDKTTAVYSLANVFSGYKIPGLIAVVGITYFLIMDVYYTLGIYYSIYIKHKYDKIREDYNEVKKLFEVFNKDYKLCKEWTWKQRIPIAGNRDTVYIPLIQKLNRRYNFKVERLVKTGEGKEQKTEKQKVIESVEVPYRCYHTQPITNRIVWIFIALVFIHSICSPAYMIFH